MKGKKKPRTSSVVRCIHHQYTDWNPIKTYKNTFRGHPPIQFSTPSNLQFDCVSILNIKKSPKSKTFSLGEDLTDNIILLSYRYVKPGKYHLYGQVIIPDRSREVKYDGYYLLRLKKMAMETNTFLCYHRYQTDLHYPRPSIARTRSKKNIVISKLITWFYQVPVEHPVQYFQYWSQMAENDNPE